MDCPALQKCRFFLDELAEMPSMSEQLKDARWVVRFALGGESVPPDLFPSQLGRANALVADTVK